MLAVTNSSFVTRKERDSHFLPSSDVKYELATLFNTITVIIFFCKIIATLCVCVCKSVRELEIAVMGVFRRLIN